MLIYLTTKFDIEKISFQIHPVRWNCSLCGECEPRYTKSMPGYSYDQQTENSTELYNSPDTWTVEVSIDDGRIVGWPAGLDAEVDFFDPEGVYLLEDNDGNTITYVGCPPECFRILDDKNMAFRITSDGYIEGWKISIELLKEWGSCATLTAELKE